MANDRLFQFQYSYERDLVNVFAIVTIGASGAPTLESNAKGVKSVIRNGAGDYTINFKSNFNKLMCVESIVLNASGIPAASVVGLKADNSSSATAPSIRLQMSAATSGAVTTLIATDPAASDKIFLAFTFRNAST